ncbi:hypothetical protein [Streptomyces roseochromogenus]|uniref:Uncharacterized protein n=1 Tax=Streptomyces roseochromogenus subsp. oscitans DS 12.976 TaxID=1352936 RepID=V6KVY8_STRRC|nr:hypothetical protein M878_03405 [Streptomyces roseochromogenus subsp. oscitans DS 12.976]
MLLEAAFDRAGIMPLIIAPENLVLGPALDLAASLDHTPALLGKADTFRPTSALRWCHGHFTGDHASLPSDESAELLQALAEQRDIIRETLDGANTTAQR